MQQIIDQIDVNVGKLRTLYNRYEVTEVGLKRIYMKEGPDPYPSSWEQNFATINYKDTRIADSILQLHNLLIQERCNGNLRRCKSSAEIKHSIERILKVPILTGYFLLALLSFNEHFVKFCNAIKNEEEYRLLFMFQ
jgi:hypothetical protein